MEARPRPRYPTSTYRLQLRSGLTFRAARELVDYFHALGVGDLYLSPFFRAASGSAHGYDIVDCGEIDPRLGTLEELSELSESLRRNGMGLLVDVVANHMAVSPLENRWWRDVLECGSRSPFAKYFDIDWTPPDGDLRGKVLAPVLTEPYSDALAKGELSVERTEEGFFTRYGQLVFPLALDTWPRAIGDAAKIPELKSLLDALDSLLAGNENPITNAKWREKEELKRRVLALVHGSEPLREKVDGRLAALSSDSERLGALLERQAYRLSHWRDASERINYRRFFDINDLAAVRVEDDEVYQATHGLLLRLAHGGVVQGLRIDHIDGLLDPAGYLERLSSEDYVIVEKILEGDERLRADWPVEGTTGYEALNRLQHLFVDPSAQAALSRLHREITGVGGSFEDVLYESKKHVLELSFRGELFSLARRLHRLTAPGGGEPQPSLASLRDAIREVVAVFPVYRTYVRPGDTAMDELDERVVQSAVSAAKRRNPETDGRLFDAIGSVLSLRAPSHPSPAERAERLELVLRFQQLTSPAMAKGLEDTAFYRYVPLVSLNEVGGGGDGIGISLDAFHRWNVERAERWPAGLTATSTHDTKRDEDVRSRIHVISEMPESWEAAVLRWRELNRAHKHVVSSRQAPDGLEEYLLYQTLVGAWPLAPLEEGSHRHFVERIQEFMLKALREAKRNTAWTDPDETYEAAVLDFVAKILDPSASWRFLDDFDRFEVAIRKAGLLNSLSQLLLKAAMPGIPDFYQGTELWELSLVDPDNRRPVDFERRRRLLSELEEEQRVQGPQVWIPRALERIEDGRLKLYLTRRLCHLRRARSRLFEEGGYTAALVEGARRDHVVAFMRHRENERLVAAAGRFFSRLPTPPLGAEAWDETFLLLPDGAGGRYREILTGRDVDVVPSKSGRALPLKEVFRYLPVALVEPL